MSNIAIDVYKKEVKQEPIRAGFGRGLVLAGERNPSVVALCADLTDSVKMGDFAKKFPERFVQVGIAEQNLVTVASGMALMGKVAQLPEVILTIALDPAENVFKVAGVKNRTGKADALARNPIELGVDLPKMHLFERQLVTSEVPNSAVAQYWSEIQ